MRFFSEISESAGNTCNPELSSHTSSVKKAGGYRCEFGAVHTAVHGKGLLFVGEQQSGRRAVANCDTRLCGTGKSREP